MNLKKAFSDMPEHAKLAYAEIDKKNVELEKQIKSTYPEIFVSFQDASVYARVDVEKAYGKIRIHVKNSYHIRQELKDFGFHYEPSNYSWYIQSPDIEIIKKYTDRISQIVTKIGWVK